MLFSELNLKDSSLKALESIGFTTPSEIQEKSIPLLLNSDIDFIGPAQTGTGKTAAFALPLLEKIDFASKDIQAFVLAPTRELANQICEEIQRLSQFEPVRCFAVYGGTSVSGQLRDLKRIRPQIVVGTPGRVIDFIDRGALELAKCRFVVLDEADEMLDMGFFDDVKQILATIEEKKIWMFSATMPRPILNLVNDFFKDPEHVKVTKQILTADSVRQEYCVVRASDQGEALCRYFDFNDNYYAIVFTKTKIGAKELTDELNARGYLADSLHGDMSQEQRDITMRRFKDKKINLLVCTDVAARGIDVTDLTHVINFSMPQDNESYVHRIGRTGRGGSKGVALSIITPAETSRIRDVERITKAKIERVQLPEVSAIKQVLMKKSMEQFRSAFQGFDHAADQDFLSFKEEFGKLTQDELLSGIFATVFENILEKYKRARVLDVEARDRMPREASPRGAGASSSQGGRSSGGRAQRGYERFHMSIGATHGMMPGDLIRFVARGIGIQGSEVGKIDIKETFSFFELPGNYTDQVLGLNQKVCRGQTVKVEVAGGAASAAAPRRSYAGGEGSRERFSDRRPAPRDDSYGNRAPRLDSERRERSSFRR